MKRVFQLLLGLTLCTSCQPPNEPVYERPEQAIIDDLKDLDSYLKVVIDHDMLIDMNTNDTISTLRTELFNGKTAISFNNLDTTLPNEIGRKAFSILVNSISNEEDYNVFEIKFTQADTVGTTTSTESHTVTFTQEHIREMKGGI